eukprot:m.68290 g.68290  ORF g.68290 m.68290 type:complete len:329 (-) comp8242_c0_seq1:455-1441(-)
MSFVAYSTYNQGNILMMRMSARGKTLRWLRSSEITVYRGSPMAQLVWKCYIVLMKTCSTPKMDVKLENLFRHSSLHTTPTKKKKWHHQQMQYATLCTLIVKHILFQCPLLHHTQRISLLQIAIVESPFLRKGLEKLCCLLNACIKGHWKWILEIMRSRNGTKKSSQSRFVSFTHDWNGRTINSYEISRFWKRFFQDLHKLFCCSNNTTNIESISLGQFSTCAPNENTSNITNIRKPSLSSECNLVFPIQYGCFDCLGWSRCETKLSPNTKACQRTKTNTWDLVIIPVNACGTLPTQFVNAINCGWFVIMIIWNWGFVVIAFWAKNGSR